MIITRNICIIISYRNLHFEISFIVACFFVFLLIDYLQKIVVIISMATRMIQLVYHIFIHKVESQDYYYSALNKETVTPTAHEIHNFIYIYISCTYQWTFCRTNVFSLCSDCETISSKTIKSRIFEKDMYTVFNLYTF